jgi:hypothetical protein
MKLMDLLAGMFPCYRPRSAVALKVEVIAAQANKAADGLNRDLDKLLENPHPLSSLVHNAYNNRKGRGQ